MGCTHAVCPECLVSYMEQALAEAEQNPNDVVPHGIVCIARNDRCRCVYDDHVARQLLSPTLFASYVRICKELPLEKRMHLADAEQHVANVRQQLSEGLATEDELLAAALIAIKTDPTDSSFKWLMCPRCRAGPYPKPRCDDMTAHHGDLDQQGGGFITNSCHGCGYFAPHASEWIEWDGVIRRREAQRHHHSPEGNEDEHNAEQDVIVQTEPVSRERGSIGLTIRSVVSDFVKEFLAVGPQAARYVAGCLKAFCTLTLVYPSETLLQFSCEQLRKIPTRVVDCSSPPARPSPQLAHDRMRWNVSQLVKEENHVEAMLDFLVGVDDCCDLLRRVKG